MCVCMGVYVYVSVCQLLEPTPTHLRRPHIPLWVCVLCGVWCVLCAVCSVQCAVCCVLCVVCCVLCAVCCVLCAVCCRALHWVEVWPCTALGRNRACPTAVPT